ncbi:hypothetical protein PMAYCL1PPCAC_08066, partial [Pristionchus mayeri]
SNSPNPHTWELDEEDDETSLKITRKKRIPFNDVAYQLDNGKFIYCELGEDLYVKQGQEKIYADLPCIGISGAAVHGNAFYFTSHHEGMVCKATHSSGGGISVSSRETFGGEKFFGNGLCIRKVNGKGYAYGMWDDSDRDGILIDSSFVKWNEVYLSRIHRGILVFVSTSAESYLSVTKLGAGAIVVKPYGHVEVYANDAYPWIYLITKEGEIHVVDMTTLKLLPAVTLRDVSDIYHICGVFNGIITVKGRLHDGNEDYLLSAQLPHVNSHINENMQEFQSRFRNYFTINKILGGGGNGVVFKVTHMRDESNYAIKRIAVSREKETHVLQEVKEIADLDHPRIIRYFNTWIEGPPEGWQSDVDMNIARRNSSSGNILRMDYQSNSSFIYMHMELCTYSLAGWLNQNRAASTRSIPRTKSWFKQILSAIDYIHDMDLIHGNLKPSNVLFADEDNLKVSDIGLPTERMEKRGSEPKGKNISADLYKSPEEIEFNAILHNSSKSDVFALGLILVELSRAMTFEEKIKAFSDYRLGKQSDRIENIAMAELVELLTRVYPGIRPTCKEILSHPYLVNDN